MSGGWLRLPPVLALLALAAALLWLPTASPHVSSAQTVPADRAYTRPVPVLFTVPSQSYGLGP